MSELAGKEFLTYDPDKESDKAVLGYLPSYRRIAGILGSSARVCEVGVFRGHSLRLWQELFPQGLIAGVDIDPDALWPDGTVRIVARQDHPALPEILGAYAPAWDLIVDDASHQGLVSLATFEVLWPLVSPGGFYVIEDWFIGLPHWRTTGVFAGVNGPGTGADSWDPGMLNVVEGLLSHLDEPFPGAKASAGLPRDSDVEYVHCRYGMAIIRKTGTGE